MTPTREVSTSHYVGLPNFVPKKAQKTILRVSRPSPRGTRRLGQPQVTDLLRTGALDVSMLIICTGGFLIILCDAQSPEAQRRTSIRIPVSNTCLPRYPTPPATRSHRSPAFCHAKPTYQPGVRTDKKQRLLTNLQTRLARLLPASRRSMLRNCTETKLRRRKSAVRSSMWSISAKLLLICKCGPGDSGATVKRKRGRADSATSAAAEEDGRQGQQGVY